MRESREGQLEVENEEKEKKKRGKMKDRSIKHQTNDSLLHLTSFFLFSGPYFFFFFLLFIRAITGFLVSLRLSTSLFFLPEMYHHDSHPLTLCVLHSFRIILYRDRKIPHPTGEGEEEGGGRVVVARKRGIQEEGHEEEQQHPPLELNQQQQDDDDHDDGGQEVDVVKEEEASSSSCKFSSSSQILYKGNPYL